MERDFEGYEEKNRPNRATGCCCRRKQNRVSGRHRHRSTLRRCSQADRAHEEWRKTGLGNLSAQGRERAALRYKVREDKRPLMQQNRTFLNPCRYTACPYGMRGGMELLGRAK